MKKLSNRIVWSPLYGGCMMEQRMVNGAWVDWNSYQEGEHPTRNPKIVKWENLRLRQERLKDQAEVHHQKYLRALAKVEHVRYKMDALSKEIRNGQGK